MHRRLLTISLLICCLAGFARPVHGLAETPASAPLTAGSTQNGMVRVRLSSLGSPSVLNLTINGSYSINGQSSRSLQNGSAVTVRFDSGSGKWTLTAGGQTVQMGAAFRLCRHAAGGQNGIRIAQGRVPGNLYPGDFQFTVSKSNGKYTPSVIVHVYMEDYLYGVLPYEMGNASPMEALKAQAVAARTYTMRAMNSRKNMLYDVVDTTSDQVYSGTPSGSSNCRTAVDATKGIVAKNGSSLTATYYTASNGGQTESIKNAWGTNGLSYLGVKDDPYDLANPDSRKASFSVNGSGSQSNSTLGRLLNQKAAARFGEGAAVTAVTAVTPHTSKYAAPSRLYTKLDFSVMYSRNGAAGSGVLTFDIFSELESALSMNLTTGSNELWSVSQTAAGFTVTARRYGHGIGMSQRGAMYMARLGYTYDQILGFYFEGCTRVEYMLTRSILSAVVPGQESQEQVIVEMPVQLETPMPTPTAAPTPIQAVVTTGSGSLNLRASARSNARVLRTVPQGAAVTVLERGSAWCQVAYEGTTGYVMTEFLTFTEGIPSPAAPTPSPVPMETLPPISGGSQTARVTTPHGSLNLRASAQDSAKVLTTVPQNDVVAVQERGTDWCRVIYDGHTGYVMTKYLTFPSDPAPTPAPVLQPTAAPPSGVPASGHTARVNTPQGSLNLRASARDSARVLRTVPQNDVVAVLQKGADWCQVAYGGMTGYVMTKFLDFSASGSAPVPSAAPVSSAAPVPSVTPVPQKNGLKTLTAPVLGRVMSKASTLNLRADCSTNAAILLEMPKYEYVTVTAIGETWCAVIYEGTPGYCMTKYLEFENHE